MYIHTSIPMHVCLNTHIHMGIYTYMCILHACNMCLCTYIHGYTHMYLCLICVFMDIPAYMYTIHVCLHTCICIHTWVCIHACNMFHRKYSRLNMGNTSIFLSGGNALYYSIPMMSCVTSSMMSLPTPNIYKNGAFYSLIYNTTKFQRVYISLLVDCAPIVR